jgi:7,8-dihydropterin-6-yl-methyl-4-(beta-D-ribofuranosyl)aminobenzene 5'-phosphate synthase
MKITLIAEGATKWQRFIKRWGVSFLLGEDVLFDTFGDPGVLLSNIRKFNIDIAKIKHIVLSHDDWDHMAGLWYLLVDRKDITVYICPGFKREIKDRINFFGVKIVEAGKITQIKEGICSTGEICGESKGRKIYEQSVVINTDDGLAVICGCAHPGVVKIVKKAKDSFNANVHWLIGGFHLKDNLVETNAHVIREIQDLGVSKIVPMHCTGKRAAEAMREAFGQGFLQISEGESLEI